MAKEAIDIDNLPEIGVSYDAVHIGGDEDQILEHEAKNDDSCFLVDWKGDLEEMFDDVNSRFSCSPVEPTNPVPGFKVTVVRDGKSASSKSFDRVEMLQAMDQVLQGTDEEMRVIVESLRSDTIAVIVKPVSWWNALDKSFPKQMKRAYVKFANIDVS